jgi:hypothetical protein
MECRQVFGPLWRALRDALPDALPETMWCIARVNVRHFMRQLCVCIADAGILLYVLRQG